MNRKDYVGSRGEDIFRYVITRWCNGKPLFVQVFMGDKHEGTDFMVELVEPTCGHAHFFVQVKSTQSRYTGQDEDRKLDVQVSARDVETLKMIHAPTYVVGIDINDARGYITGITQRSAGGISGIHTRNLLNCRTLRTLWKEVDDYWKAMSILMRESRFSTRD